MSIEVVGLQQRLGGRAILRDVSLRSERGVCGLLGPNGAGKTTLMRILATVTRPTAGKVLVDSVSLSSHNGMQAAPSKLGYLPQTFSFYDRFSALDTVEYVGWLKCVDKADLRQRAQEALGEVGLLDLANVPMRKLSGGMVRRVGIAQAIVNQPTVLLLDEPSAGLDPQQRIELRALLRRLGERATVLLSTHLVEDVASACERVVVLAEGQVRFMGQVEELAELAEGDSIGDSTLERGFTSVLRRR